MLETYIKYFFMIICSFYFYFKLLNIKTTHKNIIINICFSILVPLPLYFVRLNAPYMFTPLLIITFLFFLHYICKTSFNISLVTSVMAYSFSYFSFLLSTITLVPFAFAILSIIKNEKLCFIIVHLMIGFLQLLIAHIPFKFRRLKNGMPFILQKSSNDIGVLISICILITSSFYVIYKKNDFFFASAILFTTICGLCLFMWWKKQLTKSYLEKLRIKEMDDLKEEIKNLKEDNKNLSNIIHKDNKLIPAMEMAVQELISYCSQETSNNNLMIKSTELLRELNTLSTDRKGILSIYETQATMIIQPTGSIRIDSLIRYMQQKALSHYIKFNFTLNCNLKYMISNIIDEDSLATLIADLTENSIIASKDQQEKNILLSLNIENNNYCLNIFDSGILFEPNVIINLGKIRTTTHADTGGSGIGLMSTYEIIKKYNASFCIDETLSYNLYTKRISIYFDSMNKIYVKSHRVEMNNIAPFRKDITF